MQAQTRQNPSMEKGGRQEIRAKELLAIDAHWEGESQFSLRAWLLVSGPCCSGGGTQYPFELSNRGMFFDMGMFLMASCEPGVSPFVMAILSNKF